MGYSGAWKSQAYMQPSVQGTVPNKNHSTPEPDGPTDNWTTAPKNPAVMPSETVEDQEAFAIGQVPGGPVYSPPAHDEGIGYGAGLSFAQSSADNDMAHLRDDGSYLPRTVNPVVEFDGTYSVDRYQQPQDPDEIGSQGQILHNEWLNPITKPNRRVGHRIQRYRDRVYERRTWGVQFRPIIVPNAYTAPAVGASSAQNQYTSPYAPSQSTNVRVMPPIAPQMRRTPNPWDQSITQDPSSSNVVPLGNYGFQSWGL